MNIIIGVSSTSCSVGFSWDQRILLVFKIIIRIRTELAPKLNIRVVQHILAKAWKPYLENPNIVLEDATC